MNAAQWQSLANAPNVGVGVRRIYDLIAVEFPLNEVPPEVVDACKRMLDAAERVDNATTAVAAAVALIVDKRERAAIAKEIAAEHAPSPSDHRPAHR